MRAVANTNVVVSGLLWSGNPRRVMEAARNGAIDLYMLKLQQYEGIRIVTAAQLIVEIA